MPFRLKHFALALALPLLALSAVSGAPMIEGLPVTGMTPNVPPNIPIGKALVIPMSAYDDAGGQPTITVASSNPNIFVRARTGNPLLKMAIEHTSSGSGDPAYTGEMVFQLFHDWTPEAARYFLGFANAGYLDSRLFHRLADLHDGDTGAAPEFIYQGGGYKLSDLSDSGTPGFSYDNESAAPLIFAGRGQLALANAGNSSSYHGTNGSQFFITDGPARDLDFGYTIFGQLTHGFPVLAKLQATPRGTATTEDAGGKATNVPLGDVKITSATIVPQYTGVDGNNVTHTYTDASLILSANRAGTAVITVRATVGTASFTSSFNVTAVKDTSNSPPFFVTQPDVMTKATNAVVPFKIVDLEYDQVDLGGQLLDSFSNAFSQKGGFGQATVPNTIVLNGNARYIDSTGDNPVPYTGPLSPLLSATQWHPGFRDGYDSPTPPSVDRYYPAQAIVGISPVIGEPVVITGAPGVALTNAIVAKYTDGNRGAQNTDLDVDINWGDGTHVAATGIPGLTAGPGAYHTFAIKGTNTYAKEGTYPVVVTLTGATGWTKQIESTAIITAKKIVASPIEIVNTGAVVKMRQVATFIETGTLAVPTGYATTIDWGDGAVTPGAVRYDGGNHYSVFGTHTYKDPEFYSTSVRIHKKTDAATEDAVIYAHLRAIGFAGPVHLPPFSQAHVTGLLTQAPVDPNNANSAELPLKETVGNQTYLTCQLQMVNSGNLVATASTLRMYLCRDVFIRKTPLLDSTGKVLIPADVPLAFGPLLPMGKTLQVQTSVALTALAPGSRITYTFKVNSSGDYRLRLPVGETGTGYNLIADLQNSDPLVALEPSPQPIVGRIQGIKISSQTISTSETGLMGTFGVALDRAPTANVAISFTGDATEGTISPATITFTPANWKAAQLVTVTGIGDSALPGSADASNVDRATKQYLVTMNPAVSGDLLYNGLIGPYVIVSNADRDNNLGVAASPGALNAATGTPSTAPTLATKADTTATNHFGTITLTAKRPPMANSSVSVEIIFSDSTNGKLVNFNGVSPANPVITFDASEFTGANANSLAKSFRIEALNDPFHVGTTASYTIAFRANSPDPNYSGITPAPVTVTNTPLTANTSLGVLASAGALDAATGTTLALTTSPTASAANHSGTITLTMKKKPTADVTVEILLSSTANDKLSDFNGVSPANPKLTFSPSEFATDTSTVSKTFRIEGVQDAAHAGQTITSFLGFHLTSADPAFSDTYGAAVSVKNVNAAN